jgi:hypothetical protein
MGLWRGKTYLWDFIFCPVQMIKKHQRIKKKDTCKNKKEKKKREETKKDGKVSIKKHSVPHLGLGGIHYKKRREEPLSENHIEKIRKRQYME